MGIPRRAFVACIVLVMIALPMAAEVDGAGRHLRLTKSAPAKDAQVTGPPTEIRLWFSLPPELSISRIKLTAADGTAIKLGDVAAADENALVAAVPAPIAAGTYEVSWRTSSGDGHPLTGTFAFTVTGGD